MSKFSIFFYSGSV